MKEIRSNEFKDLLEMNELMFVEETDFIRADIPQLGAVTYYPKKNRLNVHKGNKWESDGFYFVRNHLKKGKEAVVHSCKKCGSKLALVSGTFYFQADAEPYESGVEEELDIDTDMHIHAHYCIVCYELPEIWEG